MSLSFEKEKIYAISEKLSVALEDDDVHIPILKLSGGQHKNRHRLSLVL